MDGLETAHDIISHIPTENSFHREKKKKKTMFGAITINIIAV